ncbi:MAG: hypothetical protein ACPGVN_02360 [Alphaproteobacteria bacterium]
MFAAPKFSFLATRDFEINAINLTREDSFNFTDEPKPEYDTQSFVGTTFPLNYWGENQVFAGLRLENFSIGQSKPRYTSSYDRKGIGFLALKRRLNPMIEVEFETGGFLASKDFGVYSAAKTAVDFQAIEFNGELRGEIYKLKPSYRGGNSNKGFGIRTIGEGHLTLKGIGFLPPSSNLSISTYIEFDAGRSYRAVRFGKAGRQSRLYAEANLSFQSPFEKANTNLKLSAYGNTRGSLNLNAQLDWDVYVDKSWFVRSLTNGRYAVTENEDTKLFTKKHDGWLQTSLQAEYRLNPKHSFFIEPLLRWNFKKDFDTARFQTQLFATHKWQSSENWTISNRVGVDYFSDKSLLLTAEPRVAYRNKDWAIEGYVRHAAHTSNPRAKSLSHRSIGADVSFYKSELGKKIGLDRTFDLALTGEYTQFTDGRSDKQFGIKLDISH